MKGERSRAWAAGSMDLTCQGLAKNDRAHTTTQGASLQDQVLTNTASLVSSSLTPQTYSISTKNKVELPMQC